MPVYEPHFFFKISFSELIDARYGKQPTDNDRTIACLNISSSSTEITINEATSMQNLFLYRTDNVMKLRFCKELKKSLSTDVSLNRTSLLTYAPEPKISTLIKS